MAFNLLKQSPYISMAIILNCLANYILDGSFIISKLLWSIPLTILAFWVFYITTETNKAYEIKRSLLNVSHYIIIATLASAGWFYYDHSLSFTKIVLSCMGITLLAMILDRSRYI